MKQASDQLGESGIPNHGVNAGRRRSVADARPALGQERADESGRCRDVARDLSRALTDCGGSSGAAGSGFARVRPDRTVVFRFWAPKANEVQSAGDWMGGAPVPLARNAQGVWTATQGPLEPSIYQYAFLVDGVRADDPSCRCTLRVWGGPRCLQSLHHRRAAAGTLGASEATARHSSSRAILFAIAAANARVRRVYPARVRRKSVSALSGPRSVSRRPRRRN